MRKADSGAGRALCAVIVALGALGLDACSGQEPNDGGAALCEQFYDMVEECTGASAGVRNCDSYEEALTEYGFDCTALWQEAIDTFVCNDGNPSYTFGTCEYTSDGSSGGNSGGGSLERPESSLSPNGLGDNPLLVGDEGEADPGLLLICHAACDAAADCLVSASASTQQRDATIALCAAYCGTGLIELECLNERTCHEVQSCLSYGSGASGYDY